MKVYNEYVAAKLMLIFFKVLGLAPFAVQHSPGTKSPSQNFAPIKFSPSHLGSVYNLFLIAVQFGILFVAIPNAYSDDYPNKSEVTVTFEVSASIFCNSAVLTIYLILGFRQKTCARVLNRLLSDDVRIIGKNKNHSGESIGPFFLIFLSNIVFFIGFLSTDLSYQSAALSAFRINVPSMIIAWFVTQYTLVIKLIYNRLRSINRTLLDDSVSSSSPEQSPRVFIATDASLNDSPISKIMIIRTIHANLYEIASEVSDFYSLPILLPIAHLCYIFIYAAYYLVIPFVAANETYSAVIVTNSVFGLIFSMLPIVVLASGISDFTEEIGRTSDIVSRLLISSYTNEDNRIELERFSYDLLKRKVRFTAWGLFSLDLTLVHSIFSTVVTYLIILIQHQMGLSTETVQHQCCNRTNIK